MEEIVRIPVAPGLELEGTLVWGAVVPLAEVENVIVWAQVHPETRTAVLPRVRRMAERYGQEWKLAVFCFDYRGHGGSDGTPDPAAVAADREAVRAYLAGRVKANAEVHFWGLPEPRRAELHWLAVPPGVQMPVYVYPARGESRGTVFFASVSPEWGQLHDDLAVRLVAEGYAVVGVSSVEVPERIWAATGEQVTMPQFFAAYEPLWSFAQTVTRDDRPLLLLGHSAGSSGNLLLAAHAGMPGAADGLPGLAGRVRGVVGYGNSANKGFSSGFGDTVDEQVWQLEPYLPRVRVPVYMVQGDADWITPAEVEPQVRLLGGPVHWQVIPGADHDFTGLFAELADLVVAGLEFVAAR